MLHRLFDQLERGEVRLPQKALNTGTTSSPAYGLVLSAGLPTDESYAPGALCIDVTNARQAINTGSATTAAWRYISGTAYLPIPLVQLREVVSNDIYGMSDSPQSDDSFGSVLHKGSTPVLEFINGDTDSCLRVRWAATRQDPVVFQIPLPPNLNDAAAIEVHFRAAMAGTTNTVVIAADMYVNEGDTKVEANSAAVTGTSYAEYTITLGASDVPAGAQTLTVELTPGAHATDALYLTAVWLEFQTYT